MSEYIGSESHIENVKKAGILANKKIKELKEKRIQEYNLEPKLCKNCNNALIYEKRNNSFCRRSCSTSYTNRIRGSRSIETINKISKTLKENIVNRKYDKINYVDEYVDKVCPSCNKTFSVRNVIRETRRNYCSSECRLEGMRTNVSKSQKQKVENGTHKGWQSRSILSYPEKFFIRVLKNENLFNFCETNKPYDGYFLDFYFEDLKIDLEIDGSQHKYRKEHDDKRDKYLISKGIKVYRIEWKSINTDKGEKYIKDEIDKFLNFYKKVKQEIKQL